MEGNFGRGKYWQIWRMTINFQDFETYVYSDMECPRLDESLQSLAVVVRSHTPFVHESCAVAMHYRGVVPLYISFIPPA